MAENRELSKSLAEYYQNLHILYEHHLDKLRKSFDAEEISVYSPRLKKYFGFQKLAILSFIISALFFSFLNIDQAQFYLNNNTLTIFGQSTISRFLVSLPKYIHSFSPIFLFVLLLGITLYRKSNIQVLYMIIFIIEAVTIYFFAAHIQFNIIFLISILVISFFLFLWCSKLLNVDYNYFKNSVNNLKSSNQEYNHQSLFVDQIESNQLLKIFIISLIATGLFSFVTIASNIKPTPMNSLIITISYILLFSVLTIRKEKSVLLGYFLTSFSFVFIIKLLKDQNQHMENVKSNLNFSLQNQIFSKHIERREKEIEHHVLKHTKTQLDLDIIEQKTYLPRLDKNVEAEKINQKNLEEIKVKSQELDNIKIRQQRIRIQKQFINLHLSQLIKLKEIIEDIDVPNLRIRDKLKRFLDSDELIDDFTQYINKIGVRDMKFILDIDLQRRKKLDINEKGN